MSVADPFLDPENIASKDFTSKRKGYDQDEVRAYLRRLAEASRQAAPADTANNELQAQNDRLLAEIAEMRERLEEAGANNDEEGVHVTDLISSEATIIIDAARSAAAEVIRRAEAEASRRRREVSELEQRVEAEVSEKRMSASDETARLRREVKSEVSQLRSQVEEETTLARNKADEYSAKTRAQAQEFLRMRTEEAESFHESRTKTATSESSSLRAEAEEAAENVRRSATEAAATMRREAEEESVAMVRAAEEEAAQLRAKAHTESEEAKTATAELRAGAAELSARLKEEARSDAEAAAIELRNEARMMSTEAKTLRERILADLVRRRRVARQQLDQARAARDRLARSLEEVRRKLDEATGELEMAVPEARAAMDRVGTVGNEAEDPSEVAALIKALDHSRPDRAELDTLEPTPKKREPEPESVDLANDGVAASETEFDSIPLEEVPVSGADEDAPDHAESVVQVESEPEPHLLADVEPEPEPEPELLAEIEEPDASELELDEQLEAEPDDESEQAEETELELEDEAEPEIVEELEIAAELEPRPVKSLFASEADAQVPPPVELIEEPLTASIFGTPETSIAPAVEELETVDSGVDPGETSVDAGAGVFGRSVAGDPVDDLPDDDHDSATDLEQPITSESDTREPDTDETDIDDGGADDSGAEATDIGDAAVIGGSVVIPVEQDSSDLESDVVEESAVSFEEAAPAGQSDIGGPGEQDETADESKMTKAERRKAWKSKRQAATGGLFGLPADVGKETENEDLDAEPGQDEADVADRSLFREPAAAPLSSAQTPAPFEARDSALVRIGPDLRRRMKRALADDQSEVLDGLRRGKRKLTVKDLPDPEGSRQRFAKALETPLRQAAVAGAKSLGERVDESVVESLVERVSRSVMEKVRSRVWESVTNTGGGREEVLEPIRAHYRDIRAQDLPSLAEEALAEAFAIGAYESVPDGSMLSWVLDPREATADPDCIDNADTSPVAKPATFSSGHRLPPCGDRCRCLALPAT